MSAIEFRKARTLEWEFCANGCRSRGKGSDRGPTMGQVCVFLLGHPIGLTLEDSFFCPACVKEMKATWEGALRERQEAQREWDTTLEEVAA